MTNHTKKKGKTTYDNYKIDSENSKLTNLRYTVVFLEIFRDSVSIDVWKLTVIFSIAMVLCSVRFLKNDQISNMWSLFDFNNQ